jgi:hypothetical protein
MAHTPYPWARLIRSALPRHGALRKGNKRGIADTKKPALGGLLAMIWRSVVQIKNMAQRTGLEPATPGVTGRYSNRLNYRCA